MKDEEMKAEEDERERLLYTYRIPSRQVDHGLLRDPVALPEIPRSSAGGNIWRHGRDYPTNQKTTEPASARRAAFIRGPSLHVYMHEAEGYSSALQEWGEVQLISVRP